MPIKPTGSRAPDGSDFVTLTDGQGNLLLPADNTNITALAGQQIAPPELGGRIPVSQADGKTLSPASVFSAITIPLGGGPSINTVGFQSATFSFNSVGTGNTVTFEGSSDGGTTWGPWAVQRSDQPSTAAAAQVIVIATTASYSGPAVFPLVRLRVSTYSSGTVTANGLLRQSPYQYSGSAIGNVASGVADSGNPVKVAGVYNSTLPTFSNLQRGDLQIGTRGSLDVQLLANDSNTALGNAAGLLVAPQAIATGGGLFLRIAPGQATTTVKSGAGTLYALILSTAATATNTTTIYDNTAASGTIIAVPAATAATIPTTLTFGPSGLAFGTGLTVITATANGSDMTFVYK